MATGYAAMYWVLQPQYIIRPARRLWTGERQMQGLSEISPRQPSRRYVARDGKDLRTVPNPYRSYEEWQEFHGHDLSAMSDDERRRDLVACDMAILATAPNAHWWYFNRCQRIRSSLTSRKGAV